MSPLGVAFLAVLLLVGLTACVEKEKTLGEEIEDVGEKLGEEIEEGAEKIEEKLDDGKSKVEQKLEEIEEKLEDDDEGGETEGGAS